MSISKQISENYKTSGTYCLDYCLETDQIWIDSA